MSKEPEDAEKPAADEKDQQGRLAVLSCSETPDADNEMERSCE
jgi:hypothetical protein